MNKNESSTHLRKQLTRPRRKKIVVIKRYLNESDKGMHN
jgi:hypothetical protein